MADNAEQIEVVIAALEAQRPLLGEAVVDLAIAPLRERLAALQAMASTLPEGDVAPRQQRRLVSVVFADIVGSTSLTQHLDPEDVHAVMDSTLERFTAQVSAFQGRVLQYAGDSMLAVFGAEQTREDDAERAVRAAMAVVTVGQAQGAMVLRRFGHAGFHVRVGVHTGSVLLGGGVDNDGSIRGMAVNVAARLEQSAQPGTVLISHDTWRWVSPHFEAERQAPLQVKGRDEPLIAYRVHGEHQGAVLASGRGVEGVTTPLLGRDAATGGRGPAHP